MLNSSAPGSVSGYWGLHCPWPRGGGKWDSEPQRQRGPIVWGIQGGALRSLGPANTGIGPAPHAIYLFRVSAAQEWAVDIFVFVPWDLCMYVHEAAIHACTRPSPVGLAWGVGGWTCSSKKAFWENRWERALVLQGRGLSASTLRFQSSVPPRGW